MAQARNYATFFLLHLALLLAPQLNAQIGGSVPAEIEFMGLHPFASFTANNAQALSAAFLASGCRDTGDGYRSCNYVRRTERIELTFWDDHLQRIQYKFAGGDRAYKDEYEMLSTRYGQPRELTDPHDPTYVLSENWGVRAGDKGCSISLGKIAAHAKTVPVGSLWVTVVCGSPEMEAEQRARVKRDFEHKQLAQTTAQAVQPTTECPTGKSWKATSFGGYCMSETEAQAAQVVQKQEEEESKDVRIYEAQKIAKQKKIRELGLQNGQSQAQVKSILMSHGFGPWECEPQGYHIKCHAIRRLPPQDQVVVIFGNVTQADPDSGIAYNVGRVLAGAWYLYPDDPW